MSFEEISNAKGKSSSGLVSLYIKNHAPLKAVRLPKGGASL